ncbi:ribosomal large subunit pseudouridine synthase D [Desulfocucumis palustris]|uniref:Pseudouridine synthase n=1 Tax=Desulfocucumis palustris TaxID=1898651 RepID=A0A2L2XFG2_9FIRM|nr:RluA family pseudouridine synthase [Desulfocucumis palustris]GBF32976.1 ribosomal large subunit pseudouridine synthase D [Desulfocucumis palustris]
MPTVNSYHVEPGGAGVRLDVFLAGENPDLSRSHVQKLLEDGQVTVNGGPARASYRVKTGDVIMLTVPPPVEMKVEPEPIPLDIYYEDEDVLVVNKPRGMVVHPAEGNYSGTLVNAVLYHCRDLSGINGVLRPGIVHRLDKDTSGLLMVAKNDVSHVELASQLKDRQVVRRYLALAHGVVKAERGVVDAPIGRDPGDRQRMAVVFRNGKPAVTHYRVKKKYQNHTYMELRLETGRTHQIRVHLSYIGHPVVGDPKYGPARPHFGLDGQFLHAAVLGFKHPRSGQFIQFESPLPGVLAAVLAELEESAPGLAMDQ